MHVHVRARATPAGAERCAGGARSRTCGLLPHGGLQLWLSSHLIPFATLTCFLLHSLAGADARCHTSGHLDSPTLVRERGDAIVLLQQRLAIWVLADCSSNSNRKQNGAL